MRSTLSFVLGCIIGLSGFSSNPPVKKSDHFTRVEKYVAFKTILQKAYDKGVLPSGIRKGENDTYDLSFASTCDEPDEYLGTYRDEKDATRELPQHNNDDIAKFVNLAVDIVTWENDFPKLRIPESIWRPLLISYEEAALNSKPYDLGVMIAILNKRVADSGRLATQFVFDPGCGSGGIDVNLKLDPAEGQLFLLPVFLYKLCEAQHLDPLDFKTCDRWKEIHNERVWNVSGDYMYLARWTDGVVRCGTLTYDSFKASADEKKYNIVIAKLRSPQCSPAW